MTVSLFLARLFGLYLVIIFLLLATRKEEMVQGIKSFSANPGLIMLSGIISLLGGLAVLIGHPVWVFDWPLIVTLFGVLMVVQGLVRLGAPSLCTRCIHAIVRSSTHWTWISIVTLVLGILLLVYGYGA